jgi:eukaryotic-like serine/threonine-protein kinase
MITEYLLEFLCISADKGCETRYPAVAAFATPGEAMKAIPRIPGYELLTCLGGGTLTSVYAARSLADDAACAVKLLRPDWSDQPTAIKLLQREARACFAVKHPHLIALRQAHVTRPPYYLVMDMLPGESLRRRLRRDYSLMPATALWIARQTAEALAALHRAGFIHGDVKPDNVRILAEGNAMLLDLGFAHRPGENASLLDKGYVLGTVNYLAPELCGNSPNDDRAADLFGLGVMLFEMLTGQLPYPAGSTEQTLRRHEADPPADIRNYDIKLPAGVAELVNGLLSRRPKDRPRAALVVQQLIGLEIAALSRRKSA